jgi:hypothetical protein
MKERAAMKPQAGTQEVLDHDGQPIHPTTSTAAVLDMLALGAGALMLLSAGKSRSLVGGLVKGGVAAALLGRAAKNTGTLGKVAGALSSAKRTPWR